MTGCRGFAAVYTNFLLVTIAAVSMVVALVTHDFSVSYVAAVGSRSTPLLFTVISLWGALEGSILFWAWVLGDVRGRGRLVQSQPRGQPGAVCRHHAAAGRALLPHPAHRPGQPVPRGVSGAGGRPGPESAAAEPHPDGGAPAAALPRLRRDDGAVRVRRGRDALGRGGDRRLDSPDAPLDAARVGISLRGDHRRHVVVVRSARLGRLLGVGSRRERVVHARGSRRRPTCTR